MDPDDQEDLIAIADEIISVEPRPFGRNVELWSAWRLVNDCRERSDMGAPHGIAWERAAVVLRDWHGIELTPQLHAGLRQILSKLRPIESASWKYELEQRRRSNA